MKNLILIIILSLNLNISNCQENDNYSQEVKKMLELSGSMRSFNVAITEMIGMMKSQYSSNISEDMWRELEVEMNKTSIQELTDMLVPVYQNHYTIEDIKELNKFYNSPIGKKLASHTPDIAKESMAVGQKWGKMIGEKVRDRFLEEKE